MKKYQRCSVCVMDNESDDTIVFDEKGQCNYCKEAFSQINTTVYFPNEEGKRKLDSLIQLIKENGKGKRYDCAMGISGGLDSSYLAFLGHQWGLRILAVHIDDGFDTDISKKNIMRLCSAANIHLETVAPNAKQFNALTKAYMQAGVPNIAAPQDSVLFAHLYEIIKREKIKYFLSGGNFALECVLQRGNTHGANDAINIRDIHKRFSHEPINELKLFTTKKKFIYTYIDKIHTIRPLDYIDYNRQRAFRELSKFCGFEYYGSKHLENILTAFVQLYWFPKKFRVDKRKSHLSSMIVSGQMTRDGAIAELREPIYDRELMEPYIAIIREKLIISDEEFAAIMEAPPHSHDDYRIGWIEPVIRRLMRSVARQQ